MAQQYIKAVRELGDERVIMLDGEPLGADRPRPARGRAPLEPPRRRHRAKVVLGERERRICDRVGPRSAPPVSTSSVSTSSATT
jgi:hypothetical protein